MTTLHRFVRYWLPVIVLCAAIFIQSSRPAPDVLPPLPFMDKAAHAVVYALLGALLVRAFNTLDRWRGRSLALLAGGTLLAALYGLSDEWHQSFVGSRTADSADWLADLVGGFLGSLAYLRFRMQNTSESRL